MNISDALAELRRLDACESAVKWMATQPDLETAWDACEHPDWMIWIAARRGVQRKTLVRIACACARTALRFVPDGEMRPLRAIETAEAWCDGQAMIEDVRAARRAAYAYAAAAAAAAAAADAAAYAAAAAYAPAPAYAAAAAADAAAAAYAAADARRQANIQMCAIVREHISLADLTQEGQSS